MGKEGSNGGYDKDLLRKRIEVYEDLWERLKLVAQYDRPKPMNGLTLQELTVSMYDWYFEKGRGLYLSEESRPAYFDLKKAIESILEHHKDHLDRTLSPGESKIILDLAHLLRARLANDVGTRKSAYTNVARADASNIQQVAATQLELINDYYSTILYQASQAFRWAIIAAGVGLAFFIAAVAFLYVNQQANLSTISVISGDLVEVISGINFYLYGKALGQLELFHIRLERTQRFLVANSVSENLKGDIQQTTRADLVHTIASSWTAIPENIGTDKTSQPSSKA
jgi:hypothetical protein